MIFLRCGRNVILGDCVTMEFGIALRVVECLCLTVSAQILHLFWNRSSARRLVGIVNHGEQSMVVETDAEFSAEA